MRAHGVGKKISRYVTNFEVPRGFMADLYLYKGLGIRLLLQHRAICLRCLTISKVRLFDGLKNAKIIALRQRKLKMIS